MTSVQYVLWSNVWFNTHFGDLRGAEHKESEDNYNLNKSRIVFMACACVCECVCV
jgi:hypothetical protein